MKSCEYCSQLSENCLCHFTPWYSNRFSTHPWKSHFSKPLEIEDLRIFVYSLDLCSAIVWQTWGYLKIGCSNPSTNPSTLQPPVNHDFPCQNSYNLLIICCFCCLNHICVFQKVSIHIPRSHTISTLSNHSSKRNRPLVHPQRFPREKTDRFGSKVFFACFVAAFLGLVVAGLHDMIKPLGWHIGSIWGHWIIYRNPQSDSEKNGKYGGRCGDNYMGNIWGKMETCSNDFGTILWISFALWDPATKMVV